MLQPWPWAREKSTNQNHLGHNLFNCEHEYHQQMMNLHLLKPSINSNVRNGFFSKLFFGRFYFFKNIKILIRLIQLRISSNRLDGHEFEWSPGVGDGQGGLACCNSWVAKSWTRLSNWTELILYIKITQMSIFWRVYQFFFLPYLGKDGWLWNSINTSLPLTSTMDNTTSWMTRCSYDK